MKDSKLWMSCALFSTILLISTSSYAVSLSGLLTVNAGAQTRVPIIDPATGEPVIDPVTGTVVLVAGPTQGSTFDMGGPKVLLAPGADGGILIGTYQNFVLDPDEPRPQGWKGDIDGDGIPDGSPGTGYGRVPVVQGGVLAPFGFFGTPTYVGTNPLSYASGMTKNLPIADLDMTSCVGGICSLTVDLSSWEVMWNGSAFEQGPRDCGTPVFGEPPVTNCEFNLATGSYNLATQAYSLDWYSRIVGGPFSNVLGHWHIEGTHVVPVPAAVWLFGSGLIALIGVSRRRNS